MTIRVPEVLQVSGADCGTACLAAIIAGYSPDSDGDAIKRSLEQSSRGTNLAHIAQLARKYGMVAKGLQCPVELLAKIQLPAIAHWGPDHFVVIQAINRGFVECMDPRTGSVRLDTSDFEVQYSGVVLEVSPSTSFIPIPRAPRPSLFAVIASLPAAKQRLAAIFGIGLSLEFCALAYPLLLQTAVDRAVPSGDWGYLAVVCMILFGIALLQAALAYGRGILTARFAASASFQLSAGTFWSLIQAPPSYFQSRSVGEMLAKFASLDAIRNVVSNAVVAIFLDTIFIVLVLISLFMFAPWVAISAMAVTCFFGIVRAILQKAINEETNQVISASARQSSYLLESVQAISTIRLLGIEDRRQEAHQQNIERVLLHELGIGHRLALSGATQVLLFSSENVLFIGICGYLLMNGGISLGVMLSALALKTMLSARVISAFERVMQFNGLSVHLRRLADLPQSQLQPGGAALGTGSNLGIEIDRISVRYGEDEPWVVRDFSLAIAPSEHVCLIGPSGQGKTTLLNAVAGLLAPEEGCIYINGTSLNEISLREYWSRVAVVRQDDQLLEGTIAQNVASFDNTAREQDILAALELASFGQDLHMLPLGIHTKVGPGGGGLSGGQRQRVMLARALYRKPQLLILDEATSHLDALNESVVVKNIRLLGCTVLMAAHRLETVKGADRTVTIGVHHSITETVSGLSVLAT